MVEQLGTDTLVYGVLLDGQGLVARMNGQADVPQDGLLKLYVDLERSHLFDVQGANLAFLEHDRVIAA